MTTLSAPTKRPARLWVLLAAAVAAALIGAGELARMARASDPAEATSSATLSGLRVDIARAEWVKFDHEMDNGGFAMPAQMMPDMPPAGYARLSLDVTLTSADEDAARPLSAEDEFFVGGTGSEVPLQGDTLGNLARVNPGEAVNGSLFFDLPASDGGTPLYLEWRRGGDTVRLRLDPDGTLPDHDGH